MTKLIEYLIMAFGVWMCLSPLALAHEGALGIAIPIVAGIAWIILGAVALKNRTIQWNFICIAVIGCCLAIWGIVAGLALEHVSGPNEVIVGLIVAALAFVALPFQVDAERASFYNRGGSDLASINRVSRKNENLLAKTVLLGSMPETIFIRPEELCKLVAMLDMEVVAALPGMLYKGWKKNREAAKEAKAASE